MGVVVNCLSCYRLEVLLTVTSCACQPSRRYHDEQRKKSSVSLVVRAKTKCQFARICLFSGTVCRKEHVRPSVSVARRASTCSMCSLRSPPHNGGHPSKQPPRRSRMFYFPSHASIVIFVFLFSCPLVVKASSSSSSARTNAPNRSENDLPLHGVKPDKFVASAPLIVAAVCNDGVAIIATHTASIKEPLLMDERDDHDANTISESEHRLPLDVPSNFRGPFRIQSVDGVGTTLACAGWRTDGEMLAAAFRSLASREQDRFGEPSNAFQYGRFLAEEASTWMAKCAVSESVCILFKDCFILVACIIMLKIICMSYSDSFM